MVTLHEVITFLVSMQISISSLQTHNVNRCGRSRHLARKLSLRRDRKSGSAGMPRPSSYAVFCLKKNSDEADDAVRLDPRIDDHRRHAGAPGLFDRAHQRPAV